MKYLKFKAQSTNVKQILHAGFVTPAYRQAGANDENYQNHPPPLEGGPRWGWLLYVPLTPARSREGRGDN